MMQRPTRIFAGLLAAACVVVIAVELDVIANIRPFEFEYLFRLLGPEGVVLWTVLNAGGLIVLVWSVQAVRGAAFAGRLARIGKGFLVLWLILLAWFTEWVVFPTPISVKIRNALMSDTQKAAAVDAAIAYEARHGDPGPLASAADTDRRALEVMIARVIVNRPDVYGTRPLGATLVHYAKRYNVDPVLPFSWLYLDSFYGEAVPGPMPFFRGLTGETMRDVVQLHLPSWYVESRLRLWLIESKFFEYFAGQGFGHKLRYALQKATYDASVDPFDTNVFTDIFLLMREYQGEFPELFAGKPADPLDRELARTFRNLQAVALLKPYHDPYGPARQGAAYYDRYRDDLITFARAAHYKMLLDFDFAARVQTLLVKYYSDVYARELGQDTWDHISRGQKMALVAMLRDVYTPDIGKVSYNLYLLPEFNCTPVSFVVQEARLHVDELRDASKIWRPPHADYLWAAATFKIRALSEVSQVLLGQGLAGVHSSDTVPDAVAVVARNRKVFD